MVQFNDYGQYKEDAMIIPFTTSVHTSVRHSDLMNKQEPKIMPKYTWVSSPEIQRSRDDLRCWTKSFGARRLITASLVSLGWSGLIGYLCAWSFYFQLSFWGISSFTLYIFLTIWQLHYMYQQTILDGQREIMYALQFLSRQLGGPDDNS